MNCKQCKHYNPKAYISVREKLNDFSKAALSAYIYTKRYKGFFCKAEKFDKEFPHALANLSNYNEKIMPQYCGHFAKREMLVLFSRFRVKKNITVWKYVGSFSTYEALYNAELSVPTPYVVGNLPHFKSLLLPYQLEAINNQLPVSLPLDKHELTHELIWNMLQLHSSDNDRFDNYNVWDWLRAIFPYVGTTRTFPQMSQWGRWTYSTVNTALKDVRQVKYAKGKIIVLKQTRYRFRQCGNHIFKGKGYANERRKHEGKVWVRVL